MGKLFINISQLIQVREKSLKKLNGQAMKFLPVLENAFLLTVGDRIIDFGVMNNCPNFENHKTIDCQGKLILPTWCDSHTHIVYASNRVQEFVDRINGMSYEEIAANGGGILNSAQKLNDTSFEELYTQAESRLQEIMSLGTGAVEIKSGYGLTVAGEIKMLRVINKLKDNYRIPIKSTFLGAHAIPENYQKNKQQYIDLIVDEMLPRIAKESLADFIDVFCEKDYFNAEQTDYIINKGKAYGLIPKIHVNQFNSIGGIQTSIDNAALTVDHLEVLTDEDLLALKKHETMPVALPSCSFFLSIPYTPARKILDHDISLALASDYNPGSSPSGNMNFVLSTACIKMKMTPEEAINASTINGAYAMNLENEVGSITKNKFANFIISKPLPSYHHLPYAFGNNLIESVYIKGEKI